MSDCGCDDGIGMFVCAKHSTSENDVFHYAFHAKREREPEPDEHLHDDENDDENET